MATRGIAIILFGVAVMLFGATTGSTQVAGIAGIVGLIVAIGGLIEALTEPRRDQ